MDSLRQELSNGGLGIVVTLLVRWQVDFSCVSANKHLLRPICKWNLQESSAKPKKRTISLAERHTCGWQIFYIKSSFGQCWKTTSRLRGRAKDKNTFKNVTAGLPILWTHTNNQFANKPEGLRHFRDHRWKALGKENPDLSGPFLFRHYFVSYTA